jgi:uncharacterized protein YlzI (FlbEa/FlbD family)
VIVLHSANGTPFAINAGLIERIDGGDETRVILVTGTNYVVLESVEEVVALHRGDRARVQALAGFQLVGGEAAEEPVESALPLRLVEPVNREWGRDAKK